MVKIPQLFVHTPLSSNSLLLKGGLIRSETTGSTFRTLCLPDSSIRTRASGGSSTCSASARRCRPSRCAHRSGGCPQLPVHQEDLQRLGSLGLRDLDPWIGEACIECCCFTMSVECKPRQTTLRDFGPLSFSRPGRKEKVLYPSRQCP
jgi:hypothetical protein